MRGLIAIALLLVAGCGREPSFDERYATAEKDIRDKAATMDAEMAAQEQAGGAAQPPPSAAR